MSLPFPHLLLRLPEAEEEEWKSVIGAEASVRREHGEIPGQPLRSLFVVAGRRGGEVTLARDLTEVVGADVVGSDTEWTLELMLQGESAILSRDALRAWLGVGVNRISLAFPPPFPRDVVPGERGLATHLESLVSVASRLLAEGVPVVNVDLPLGSNGRPEGGGLESTLRVLETLDRIQVPQLTIHERVEGDAPGSRVMHVEPDGDEEDGWLRLVRCLEEAGYVTGDGVHFVREGACAVHPRAILRREPVLGLGPGAVTFRNPERRANVPEWRGYRRRALAGLDPIEWRESLDRGEVRTERVWSYLRCREGLRMGGMGPRSARLIRGWVSRGWATVAGGRVILLPDGWIRMDGLVVDLLRMEEEDRGTFPSALR